MKKYKSDVLDEVKKQSEKLKEINRKYAKVLSRSIFEDQELSENEKLHLINELESQYEISREIAEPAKTFLNQYINLSKKKITPQLIKVKHKIEKILENDPKENGKYSTQTVTDIYKEIQTCDDEKSVINALTYIGNEEKILNQDQVSNLVEQLEEVGDDYKEKQLTCKDNLLNIVNLLNIPIPNFIFDPSKDSQTDEKRNLEEFKSVLFRKMTDMFGFEYLNSNSYRLLKSIKEEKEYIPAQAETIKEALYKLTKYNPNNKPKLKIKKKTKSKPKIPKLKVLPSSKPQRIRRAKRTVKKTPKVNKYNLIREACSVLDIAKPEQEISETILKQTYEGTAVRYYGKNKDLAMKTDLEKLITYYKSQETSNLNDEEKKEIKKLAQKIKLKYQKARSKKSKKPNYKKLRRVKAS